MNNTTTEMIIFDKRENFFAAIGKDITTLLVMGLLIYISIGSNFWTLVCGLMFISWMVFKFKAISDKRIIKFKSKAEVVEWANKLEDF